MMDCLPAIRSNDELHGCVDDIFRETDTAFDMVCEFLGDMAPWLALLEHEKTFAQELESSPQDEHSLQVRGKALFTRFSLE
jgi:hypothetical protein